MLFVITPIIYWLILKNFKWFIKITSITLLWITTILISYWDVYQISIESERLCKEEAGLHVYETVEVEGFLGPINIEYWTEYGFKYVEGAYKGNKTRSTFREGEVVREIIQEYTSRYQVKTKTDTLKSHFVKRKKMIVDRQTNEILGDLVSFAVYPGWLDSRLLGLIGFTWSPARCDGDYPPESQKITIYPRELIKAVFETKDLNKGVK